MVAFIKYSVSDILKLGIGSSSSHTLAPWRSAQACYQTLQAGGWLADLEALSITLHGSLAFVGRGHYTTVALPLGFMNLDPMTFDVSTGLKSATGIASVVGIGSLKTLAIPGGPTVDYQLIFDTVTDTTQEKMVFQFRYRAGSDAAGGRPDSLTYYSYGGGSYGTDPVQQPLYTGLDSLPVTYASAQELVEHLGTEAIADGILRNEQAFAEYRRTHPDPLSSGLPTDLAGIVAYLKTIAVQMGRLIYDGCTYADDDECYKIMYATPRAKAIYREMIGDRGDTTDIVAFFRRIRELARDFSFDQHLKLVGLFALAVSEQNSALKNVVTAPTNGSCGTVPAVLYYYVAVHASEPEFDWLFGEQAGVSLNGVLRFLLVASMVGGIVKNNANISGGLGGCQAEVGTSAAMAAGGLAYVLSAQSPVVTFNAAEQGLEAMLGSTCDPIGGLVELPCIDRNLTASIMAISVSQSMLELGSSYQSTIPFDQVVTAMEDVSNDMSDKYKETSTGGLALVMLADVEAKRPDLFPDTKELRAARALARIPIFRVTC